MAEEQVKRESNRRSERSFILGTENIPLQKVIRIHPLVLLIRAVRKKSVKYTAEVVFRLHEIVSASAMRQSHSFSWSSLSQNKRITRTSMLCIYWCHCGYLLSLSMIIGLNVQILSCFNFIYLLNRLLTCPFSLHLLFTSHFFLVYLGIPWNMSLRCRSISLGFSCVFTEFRSKQVKHNLPHRKHTAPPIQEQNTQ